MRKLEGGRADDPLHQPQARRGDECRRRDHRHACGPGRRDDDPVSDQRRGARRAHGRRAVEPVAARDRAARPSGRAAVQCARPRRRRHRVAFERLGPLDLDVFPGEIVGVAGVGGNGQDELVACAAGLPRPAAGTIAFAGRDLTERLTSRERRAARHRLRQRRSRRGGPLPRRSDPRQFRSPAPARAGLCCVRILAPRAIGADARKRCAGFSVRYGALGDPAGKPLRRQPAAPRHRARTRSRAEAPDRRPADARRRHRRDGLHSSAPARLSRSRRRGSADFGRARRDARALRSHRLPLQRPDSLANCRRSGDVGALGRMMLGQRRHDRRDRRAAVRRGWRGLGNSRAAAPFALALASAPSFWPDRPRAGRGLPADDRGGLRRRAAHRGDADRRNAVLLLTGLAAAIAFRAGIFNVGAEGCFYLGGMAAAVARLQPRRLALRCCSSRSLSLAAALVGGAVAARCPASCARGSGSTRS